MKITGITLATLVTFMLGCAPSSRLRMPVVGPMSWSVCGNSTSTDQSIQDCRRIEGSVKTTKRGVRFLLVASSGGTDEVWKDTSSGLIWSEPRRGIYSWKEAKELCAADGLNLPSVDQFEEVKRNGFEEVAPDTLTGYWYWTSTPTSGWLSGLLAQSYQGLPHGYVVNLSINDRMSVRCVAR